MCTTGADSERIAGGEELAYGCLFCRTGKEKRIAEEIEKELAGIRVVFAEKLRKRRQGGGSVEESVALFPGYLFFRACADFDARALARRQDVYRLLCDGEGIWHLRGSDLKLARGLFDCGGVVGFSSAYYEGDRIRITDGLLKAYEGQIIRVNRRNQTAQIALGLDGREVTVWLGFELIEKGEPRKADGANSPKADADAASRERKAK